ncbi:DUF1236 domain-containing protein [Jiella sp. MQZ9-1]|uniref:DUF1236 domain-containing protein n=1 Tax=Jiella flava TaxID=2816857 RepID=A0A939FXY9_9HYPH|nr:DUF1236 domain-containing protein [Jiella flava]MBO0662934.1 DUF1236 domain-containing protein [Jiella flava]MCD2471306.1 DUF1236 domain-containing protein [Jiella flava]
MKRILLAAALAAAVPAAALAQTTTTTTTVETTQPVQPETKVIRTYVTKESRESFDAGDGYTVAVGTDLPAPVPLYRLPDDVGPYQYTVVNHKTVVVDPTTRKVIEIIE